jgi:hypothetical protein
MARTKAQEADAIARLADASEEALRQLVDFPHRVLVRSRSDVRDQLHQIATKLRAIDPLVARVTELEKRLASLEQHSKATTRKAPARPKKRASRKPASPAPVTQPPADEPTADLVTEPAETPHTPIQPSEIPESSSRSDANEGANRSPNP